MPNDFLILRSVVCWRKKMDTDNAFETLIELLSTPVMILLDEQENGGKVSNLLDNNEKESVHVTKRWPMDNLINLIFSAVLVLIEENNEKDTKGETDD